MRFDHAILAVLDLEAAQADFHALGFRTAYGGAHGGGLTHNALIGFADGSYLELMAPANPAHLQERPEQGYLYLFRGGEGFAGYALHTDDLDGELRAMRARGLAVGQAERGGRRRSDGVQLAWRMAATPDMSPFFLTDETPRPLRVAATPQDTEHPNGAAGVLGLVVPVADLARASERHRAITGGHPKPGSALPGARTADFTLGEFRITLAEPVEPGGPLAAALRRRGEAPCLLRLRGTAGESGGLLDPARTHGAQIELVASGGAASG